MKKVTGIPFRWDPFSLLASAITLYFFARFLIRAARIPISLGDDSFVALGVPGRFLARTFPDHFISGLFASNRGEDHLFPLYYLFGFFTELLSNNSLQSLIIGTKLTHIAYTAVCCLIVHRFWKSHLRLLVFFIFFTFNLNLTWRSMVSFAGGFAPLLGAACLFWIYRILQRQTVSLKDFTILFILSLLMSFGLETAFSNLLLFAGFTTTVSFTTFDKKQALKRTLLVGFVLFLSFVPYLVIHQYIYGLPLPSPRNAPVAITWEMIDNRLISYLRYTFFEPYGFLLHWSFFYTLLGGPVLFFILGLGRGLSRGLYLGLLFSIVAILMTGRSEHGLWLLSGTVILMIYADIFSEILEKFHAMLSNKLTAGFLKPTLAIISFGLPVLVTTLIFHDCVKRVDPLTRHSEIYAIFGRGQQAFSKAVGEASPTFLMYRTSPHVELPHRDATWIGNQMQFGAYGLSLVPDAMFFTQLGGGVFVQQKPIQCETLRKIQLAGMLENSPVMVFSNNHVLRYAPSEDLLLRAVFTSFNPGEPYELCIPPFVAEKGMRKAELRVTPANPGELPRTLRINGQPLQLSPLSGYAKVEFDLDALSSITLTSVPSEPRMDKIEISPIGWKAPKLSAPSSLRRMIKLSAGKASCMIKIASAEDGDFKFFLPQGESILYQPPHISQFEKIELSYHPFRMKKYFKGEQWAPQNIRLRPSEKIETFFPCDQWYKE